MTAATPAAAPRRPSTGRPEPIALLLLACLLLLAGLAGGGEARAQAALVRSASESAEADSDKAADPATSGLSPALQALVRAAEAEGATVLVIGGPKAAPAAAAPAEPNFDRELTGLSNRLRQRVVTMLAEVPSIPGSLASAVAAAGPPYWPLVSIALTLGALAVGYLVFHLYRRWAQRYIEVLFNPDPKGRAEKISYLLTVFMIRAIGLVVHLVTAAVILVAIDYGPAAPKELQLRVLLLFGTWRLASYFYAALLASDTPSHRLLRLSDQDARHLQRNLSWLILLGVGLLTAVEILDALVIQSSFVLLARVVMSFVVASLFVGLCFVHRRPIGALLCPPDAAEGESAGRRVTRLIARLWPVLAALYFYLAWTVLALRVLLGSSSQGWLVSAPFFAVMGALALYGIAVMLLDWAMPPSEEERRAEAERSGRGLGSFRALAERAISIVIVAGAVAAVYIAWGVDIFAGIGFIGTVWELVLIAFVAYLAYQAVKIAVDRRIALEGGPAGHGPAGGEEGGHGGGSRLATLLPLFRNFLLIVILVMATMIGLSQMGVDIAPLFAGAGVVGLAIGFGAQTLIKDIFSGAFFLMDDAFRVGEYIDIGTVKGTVERISVRSMQLRHQLGTLVTVPFGEIQHLSNFSRDWVIMKLPLRLTYDTDVNKVNKLIKNLGKELLKHELIGDKFLEPLKSQGVWMMDDSAQIIRVKFMTRPGEQFQVRKIVYAEIRELFEREGIRFASREVKVRLDEADQGRELSDADKAKIAAAAQPVIAEQETGAGPGGLPDPGER